jgi:uncharacterized protein (TIGR02118 family)
MIRLVALLRRRGDLELDEFHRRWRDVHGPLVAGHQTTLNVLRYTQTHRLEEPVERQPNNPRGPMEAPYDGVSEMWFESEEALLESLEGDAWATVLDDEAELVDRAASPVWLAHEYPQFSSSLDTPVARQDSGLIKVHFVLRSPAAVSDDDAQRYWRTHHGPLIRSMRHTLGILTYQQVHRFVSDVERQLRERRGTTVEPYLGHAEMWIDRSVSFRPPEQARSAVRAFEDETRFIDFDRSSSWSGKEFVFVDQLT